jgi:CBS domain-containing protein
MIRKELTTCQASASVHEVAELMDRKDIGAVLVVEGKKPVGIITDRDLVVRCLSRGMDCKSSRVEDIMTKKPETAKLDDGIYDVVERMKDGEIRRLPVVDENGDAVALVSFGDIFELLAEELHKLAAPARPEKKKIDKDAA